MKLLILDRDGVINKESEDFIKHPDEWQAIPGSLEAIARLNHAGYQVVLISNHCGIGQGQYTIQDLNAIHDKMQLQLAQLGGQIQSILFCPHAPDDNCQCRKPHAGLFTELQTRLNLTLNGVPAVGDSLEDLQAAREIGATPVLVKTGHGEATLANAIGLENVQVFDDLAGFTESLLAQQLSEDLNANH